MEITERLLAVASFVRDGAYLCDVGTDHAYLPIYLAENGKIRAATASDIHEGPCESARTHIAANGFGGVIEVKRANGLEGFVPREKTDIAIAGMGGALICEILEKADNLKNADIRLILQPMRNVPDLRAYLYENGFAIIDEKLAREEDRIYEIICAEYRGEKRAMSELSLLLGEKNIEGRTRDTALFTAFCEKQEAALCKKINGKREGGADTSREEALLAEIRALY